MEQQVISITQLNSYLAQRIDSDPNLVQIAVRGEISNFKTYPSGHSYFSLKDESSCLKCVLFRGNALKLRFRPENGMKVIAMGKVSVYLRDGVYQLSCSAMVPDGIGDLYAAFEQLKSKLNREGLFDPEHKKKIPMYPRTIGIVTSSAGAAVHDILRILKKRYPLANARLFPVRVQGIEAPDEISAAIAYANRYRLADLLIVGRGGGSIEDLWAFNDERVARAIYDSVIPVISAVGHEPDVTIADYVADLRAATPSNAAELSVPDRAALQQWLDDSFARMAGILTVRVNSCRKRLEQLAKAPTLSKPTAYLQHRRTAFTHLQSRLLAAASLQIQLQRRKYTEYAAKLDAMSPLKVISRGYAMVSSDEGELIRSVAQVSANDRLQIRLIDGSIAASVTNTQEDRNEYAGTVF